MNLLTIAFSISKFVIIQRAGQRLRTGHVGDGAGPLPEKIRPGEPSRIIDPEARAALLVAGGHASPPGDPTR